jgi:hypothetical protein
MGGFGNIVYSRDIEMSAIEANLVTGTNPTTTAAARSFLSSSGTVFVTFGGGNNVVDGCSFSFKVPDTFIGDGILIVNYTTDTSVNYFKLQCIVTAKNVGEDFTPQTETGLFSTNQMGTAFTFNTLTITPTTTFIAGQEVSVRLYRIANDAADTSTLNIYIKSLTFNYQGT